MKIDKLPNQGDFSGQPFEFQLSGVRTLRSGREMVYTTFAGGGYFWVASNAEQTASSYTVGQTISCVVTTVNNQYVTSGGFTITSVASAFGEWEIIGTMSGLDTAVTYNVYPQINATLATSISVTITDTVTSEATTFNFPVTTAGDAQFYLGSFIDDAIRAKGLTIPNVDVSLARAGDYNITVNNVVLNYVIGFGGRFNVDVLPISNRAFTNGTKYFRRDGGSFIYSFYINDYVDNLVLFSDYPNNGLQPIGTLGDEIDIIPICKKKDYQLKTLQIGSNTYDVTAPILRFLNPIGGVEEALASGNNELTLNQGDTRFFQTILGETKIAGRNNSYQGMTLELVPQDYLTNLRDIEAEINRLTAIQYSDYVELVVVRQQFGSSFWDSIPVIVTPASFVIASNNSNQLRQSITFEITFASPL
jgi:hypothetical protein